jgi:transposase-like protein
MEFHDWFATETACRQYLVDLRWPQGPRCPDCKVAEVWLMKAPFYRCGRCRYDFSVTIGTLFADAHKPLRLWFEAIWYLTNQKSGGSALGLQRVLRLGSYRTAWSWLHKLRRAMVRPGRDVCRRAQARQAWAGSQRKEFGFDSGPSGWAKDRPYSFDSDCRRFGGESRVSCDGIDRSWHANPDRRLERLLRIEGFGLWASSDTSYG